VVTLDIIVALQQLGLTEYEAKTYVALLKHPDSNGYELAKFSGVPRAKIYEALNSLERKGALLTATTDGRQLYRALPYEDLLNRFKSNINATVTKLEAELAKLVHTKDTSGLYTVRGEEHNYSRAREIILSSRARLLLTGFPEDITALLPELKQASERGVRIDILNYGEGEWGLSNVYNHPVTGAQYLQVAAFGRWLAVVRDNEEAFLAQMRGSEESVGFVTNNEIVILGLSMWLYHDIQINMLVSAAPPDVLEQAIKMAEPIQDIIFWDAHEVPDVKPELTWPTAQQILEHARLKMQSSRLPEDHGIYRFDLVGEGGGMFELNISAGGVALSPAYSSTPDLTVRLSVDDFRAMAVGKLPLAAITAKGRIRVTGDLALASNLQRVLR